MSGTCTISISNSPVFSPTFRHSPFSCRSSPSPSNCASSSPSPSLALSTNFRTSFKDDDLSSGSNLSPSVVPLKRKRPARLDIPVASLGLAATPRAPSVEAVVEDERDGFYSVCCRRGKKRAVLEDRFCADRPKGFFGVFDGHGGCRAAEFAARNIGRNIMEGIDSDERCDLEEAVRDGYLKTDSQFLKEDSRGGSCCVTALIRNGDVVVSNAGDCRAVVSKGGIAEALTSDHRPSRADEKKRIESTGGYIDCYQGVWRIQGTLAVSRGIGDGHLKQWVIAEPETRTHSIEADSEFLILASDGLWDKVTDQEAVDVARSIICSGKSKPDGLAACKKLVDLSALRGSLDDISVMLIQLQHYI